MAETPYKKGKRKEVNALPWVILVVALICGALWFVSSNSDNSINSVATADTVTVMLPPPALLQPPPPPPPPQNEPPPPSEEEEMIEQEAVDENEPLPDESSEAPPPDIDLGPGSAGGSGPAIGGGRGGNGNRIGSGRGGGSKFGWYAAKVQTSIRGALSRNPATRSATLSIQVRIWVDVNGRVTRTQLVGSSGNPAVDLAIRNQVLTGLMLPQPPPADLPMPINLRLTARKPANG